MATADDFEPYYAFRAEMANRLTTDLVGPDDPTSTETITDRPITRYAAGILFPRSAGTIDDEIGLDEEQETGNSSLDAAIDPAVSMANTRYPSSMGLTFAVDSRIAPQLTVTIRTAKYIPEKETGHVQPRAGRPNEERWRRVPIDTPTQHVAVVEPGDRRFEIADGLELFVRIRQADESGHVSMTVALTNVSHSRHGDRDEAAFFQPQLVLAGPNGTNPFVERAAPAGAEDRDLESYRLLYRHTPKYAVGHGCAVEWESELTAVNAIDAPPSASVIRTTFVPRYDLWMADSNPAIDTSGMTMAHLANADDAAIRAALDSLVSGYRSWIASRRSDVYVLPDSSLVRIAEEHLGLCDDACRRMEAGIAALADRTVMSAFRLTNRAMAMQRGRTELLKDPNRFPAGPDETIGEWRPFQIAFLLLCIPGVVDPTSNDRNIADVLWFPTGGGKTEAYLGLLAFTVFLRRLRDPGNGGGTTVLMRYTLRLLTLQQFERAALLICCMEHLRRGNPVSLGEAEISIGMWVGEGATPNRLEDAKASLRKLSQGEQLQKKNPVQLRACPWCGRAMDWRDYSVRPTSLVITCGQDGCAFKEGLPVHVVDETIYAARPTLIIATADKFAAIPWNANVAELFNRDHPEPPPNLIIQDELHLISGPLGTLTGLYETAIDLAADRPKIIASTATIRRAGDQGHNLFDRDVRQFPPPGLDARDSYFAIQRHPEHKPSRLYLGVMAPATSQTSLLVRTYAALLHAAQAIKGDDRTRDPFWTLVGYFNSLRLLAGARLQVQDDVDDRLSYLAELLDEPQRMVTDPMELTSREPSSEIPSHLKEMARSLPDDAIDVILATNLISVGVDVDRLGLMAVMGQPQSTSEYIQATSRIGRRWPGLAVAMYNGAKSRDRSHYEDFLAYHSALYRQVEATSVTPFSARARDRGLHAVIIGLARLLIPGARARDAAAAIGDFEADLRVLCEKVLERVGRTMGPVERAATAEQIDAIIGHWLERAADKPNLVYDDRREPANGLLVDAARFDESDDEVAETFPTLRSLRDVDVESKLYIQQGAK